MFSFLVIELQYPSLKLLSNNPSNKHTLVLFMKTTFKQALKLVTWSKSETGGET